MNAGCTQIENKPTSYANFKKLFEKYLKNNWYYVNKFYKIIKFIKFYKKYLFKFYYKIF